MKNNVTSLLTAVFLFFFSISNLCASSKNIEFWPYLGVYTSALEREVSHQLDLPLNLYLNVEKVEDGSPASISGVQQFDILLKLNDQILVNPDQLKYLVRSKKPDDLVSLNLIRKGKSKTIELKLGKTKQLDESGVRNPDIRRNFGNGPFPSDPFSDIESDISDFLDRHRHSMTPFPYFDRRLKLGRIGNQFNDHSIDDDPLHSATDINTFSQNSSKSQFTVIDDDGTLGWEENDGKKTLRFTDPSGKIIFDGPINTAEEKKSLPPVIAKKLKKLEKNMPIK